jgi:hypothetical protein
LSETEFGIRPGDRQDLSEIFSLARTRDSHVSIVHLWSLDAPNQAQLTSASLDDAHAFTVGSVVDILKELAAHPFKQQPPQVWLVTAGCATCSGAKRRSRSRTVAALGFGTRGGARASRVLEGSH